MIVTSLSDNKNKKMGFKLNINKSEEDGKGKGSAGFSLGQAKNIIKSFTSHIDGNDVMKDGYYNIVNESGSGMNMNVPGPMYQTGAVKHDEDDDIEREFDYGDDSGKGGVKGTAHTRDTVQTYDTGYSTDANRHSGKEGEDYSGKSIGKTKSTKDVVTDKVYKYNPETDENEPIDASIKRQKGTSSLINVPKGTVTFG